MHPFLQTAKGLELTTNLSYEYVDKKFQPLERLRPVEFLRDWGLPLQLPQANETFYNAAFSLKDKKSNEIHYELAGYNRGTDFTGVRNTIGHTTDIHGWKLNDQISYTNGNGDTSKG